MGLSGRYIALPCISRNTVGEMLRDGLGTYSHQCAWDAEGRMATGNYNGSSVTYVYNALGQRVERSGSSVPHVRGYATWHQVGALGW